MSEIENTDVIIIGAGPVGLFSVFECGLLGMKCHVVDSLEHIGGQCIALYPEKPIYDIPAYPKIMAQDLIAKLTEQAKPYNPNYHLNQKVMSFEKFEGDIVITTSENKTIRAKSMIIAAGAGAFGPNKPPLANIEDYEGSAVFYMVGDRNKFKDKKIVIAGGGDSAVDWAISLSEVAEQIYLVHRRDRFRAAPDSINKLNQIVETGKIKKVVPSQLTELKGDGCHISEVIVSDLDGNKTALDANYLLPFYGLANDLGKINDWDLNINNHHINIDPATSMTNIEDVYAIGDVASYQNKLKLILTGFSEAAMAAHSIYPKVFGKELHFEHSTTIGQK